MKIIHNPLLITLTAVCAMLLTGCTEENFDNTANEQYVRDFIDRYGIPDSEHTWSMARSVATDVDVVGLSEGTVEIFTDYPGTPGARMIARLPFSNGKASASLPVSVGAESVYMRVKDTDNTTYSVTRVPLDNANGSASARVNVMSAPAASDAPVPQPLTKTANTMDPTTRSFYQQFLAELRTQDEKDNFTYQQCAEMYLDKKKTDPDTYNQWRLDVSIWHPHTIPQLKKLDDLYYEMGPALSYKDVLAPIFNEYTYTDKETGETRSAGGVFKERQNNIDKYYHNATNGLSFEPDVTFAVREKGPVTMQCIWRGTQKPDCFGYFYYKAGTDLTSEKLWNDIPKYIFLNPEDIMLTSSLTQYNDAGPAHVEDESQWKNMIGDATSNCGYWSKDRMVRGRKYYLAYYGENYDEPGSYIFPTGIRIGYFIYREENIIIYFSNCRHEYELCGLAYAPNNTNIYEEGPLKRPYAAKFRMGGRNYIGMGDGTGDCDLNDVVFIAENVYPDPVDITPAELKDDTPVLQTWTLACEDMGSAGDVDFNDIVLDVSYMPGESTLTIIPRAAGGTLVSNISFREVNNDYYRDLGEIHALLAPEYGEGTSEYPMLNTDKGSHQVDPATVKPITVTVPPDFNFASPTDGLVSRIRITTRQADQQEQEAKVINAYVDIEGFGTVPQILLLDGEWQWPTETTGISTAYPDFRNWVKDHDSYYWIKNMDPDYTVSYR